MDLKKVREVVHSLSSWEYIQFMHELHYDYPLKTKELTEEIVKRWKNDQSMKAEQFNEIIREREVEHNHEVREKRQADLKRIQNMKSRTGLDPLQLFPKEIWMMILNELKPEDKRNVREVHQIFHDLTDEGLAGEVHLPMILGFEVEHFWSGHAFMFEHFGRPNPLRARLGEYAKLRLVSKSLRNAIDRWFEDDLISRLHNGDRESKPPKLVQFDLLSTSDLQKWKKLTSEPRPLRFFTRSLAFVTPKERYSYFREGEGPEKFAEFPQVIETVLDHIGDQIWYFSFEFHRPDRDMAARYPPARLENRYKSLLGWLARMPNLKWLKVIVDQSQKQTRTFKIPEGSSPPTLTHLERMDFEFKKPNIYLMPICNELLSANTHVKILNLIGVDYHVDDLRGTVVLDSLRTSLSSLEVLMLSHPSEHRYDWIGDEDFDDDDVCDIDEFCRVEGGVEESMMKDQLFAISSTNCLLKRIELKLESKNPSGLFRSLSNFQSLEKVVLSLGSIYFSEDDDNSFLKLPQLTHFELDLTKGSSGSGKNGSFFYSLQFLLFAKKLNTLIWKCDMWKGAWNKLSRDIFGNHRVGEMIDFAGGLYDIEGDSNLWNVFPWLQTVKVDRIIDGDKKQSFSKVFRRCERERDDDSSASSCSSSSQEDKEET